MKWDTHKLKILISSQNTLGGRKDDAGEEGLAYLSRQVEKGEAELQS